MIYAVELGCSHDGCGGGGRQVARVGSDTPHIASVNQRVPLVLLGSDIQSLAFLGLSVGRHRYPWTRPKSVHFVNGALVSHVAHRQPASLAPISRLNTKLEANGYPPMHSLVQDLADGVRLIQLMVRPTLVPRFVVSLFTFITSQQEIMGNCHPSPA